MADTKTDAVVKPHIEPRLDLEPPNQYKLIYINDEVTTMEFVVETLKSIFDYSNTDALAITHQIHEEGAAVVAVLPYEMAEQKGVEVTVLARNNGFPLQVKVEADI
jgi:ATP-dependent Clp protease adaptor protein ClpS